jgi:hypothetical protein
MLHQTVTQMYTSQRIACVNGPWWFVQLWLQLHMHQIVGVDLNTRLFPSSNYHEGELQVTRGCHTYGEAASTVLIKQNVSQLFELFFKGFQNPLWLPYLDNDNLTLLVSSPLKLNTKMEDFWKSSTSSSTHAFCQLNSVEGG